MLVHQRVLKKKKSINNHYKTYITDPLANYQSSSQQPPLPSISSIPYVKRSK